LGDAGAEYASAPLFFLSYALGPDDGYVRKLYDDLTREVRRRGFVSEPVGFFGASKRENAAWQQAAAEALASCRVFVPIYSPRYFDSETCGRQWAAFARRFDSGDDFAAAVLPVQWVPALALPPVAQHVPVPTAPLGDIYAERGLYGIIRTRRFEDEYEIFLAKLTDRVLDAARRSPPPPATPVRLDEVESAFPTEWRHRWPLAQPVRDRSFGRRVAHFRKLKGLSQEGLGRLLGRSESWVSQVERGVQAVERLSLRAELAEALGVATTDLDPAPGAELVLTPPRGRPPRAEPGPAEPDMPRGSRHIHFVFAAPTIDELPAGRTSKKYYGDYVGDWRPFLPDDPEPLSLLVQIAAATRKFTSELHSVDETLFIRLDTARMHNQLVILLVDPWALTMGRYQEILSRYDNANEPTSGVLIPWSDSDAETHDADDLLTGHVNDTFLRNIVRNDTMFRTRIGSAEEFEAAISEVLIEANNRVFSLGDIKKSARSKFAGRPELT
jgi:FxsC-like protein